MNTHSMITLAAAAASIAGAGPVTLHIDADRETALTGETVHWTVSVSFEGYPDPTAYVGGFVGDLLAGDPAAALVTDAAGRLSTDTGSNTPDGASLRDVIVNNLALLGTDDPSNPIEIFGFSTLITSLSSGDLVYDAEGRVAVHPDNGDFTAPDFFHAFDVVSDTVAIDAPGVPTVLLRVRPDTPAVSTGEPLTWTVSLTASGWDDPDAGIRAFEGAILPSDPGIGAITDLTPLNGSFVTGGPVGAALPSIRIEPDLEDDLWAFGESVDILRFTLEPAFPGSISFRAEGDATGLTDPVLGGVPLPIESDGDDALVRYVFHADRMIGSVVPVQSRENDLFGNAIDIDGERIVIAAMGADTSTGEGVAYLYSTSGHRFSTLTPGLADSHFFGSAVALDGDTAAIGTVGYASLTSIPRAFLFDVSDPANPVRTCTLIAGGDTAFQEFGFSIGLGDGVLAVGAPDGHRSEFAGATAGSIYLYDRDCTLLSQIVPPDGEPRDFFAESFAIKGDLLLAGAWGAGPDVFGVGPGGKVYLYDISDPAAPALLHTFERPESVAWGFGYSVDLADGWCAIASRGGTSVVFYDLTDPAAPTEMGVFTLGFESLPMVAMDGDTAALRFQTNEADLYHRTPQGGVEFAERVEIHETMYPQTVASGLAIDGDLGAFGMAYDSTVERFVGSARLFYPGPAYACNGADLAEPLGQHDLADLVAFASAFVVQDAQADLNGDGLFDLADVTGFVGAFTAGCP